MPKYKNNRPEIVEGFLEKMFGALATSKGQQIAAKMAEKDPEIGKKLKIAQKAMADARKQLSKMSPSEKKKHFADLRKSTGLF